VTLISNANAYQNIGQEEDSSHKMPDIELVIEYTRRNQDRYVSELKEYLSIPSISTLPEHKADVERAAQWVATQLRQMGFERVDAIPTEGHPMVVGEWLKAKEASPTALIYGHYDVQPVDPLGEWKTPPFSPSVRGDEIFARGAADMKGGGEAVLKAMEAWIRSAGALPVNVKILFEGEEEIGSPHIDSFIVKNKERLVSSFCVNCDGGLDGPDKPVITRGLRGVIAFELLVNSSSTDLHSGGFGGTVPNSAVVLCELIAGMHNVEGKVTLPRFYDDVRNVTPEERADMASHALPEAEVMKLAGVKQLFGEKGFSPDERVGIRPTLEVNGMSAGFTGEGTKTVIPAKALAKLSMRTVPYQDADKLEASLREHLTAKAPPYVDWELKRADSGPFALLETGTPLLEAVSRALEDSYGKRPYTGLAGGSVPVVAILKERLGLESVLLGCALPDCNAHAPNEKLHIPTFMKGIETFARFLLYVSDSRWGGTSSRLDSRDLNPRRVEAT